MLFSSSGSEQVDLKFYDILDQILEMQPPTTRTVVTDLTNDISEESDSDSLQGKSSAHINLCKLSNDTLHGYVRLNPVCYIKFSYWFYCRCRLLNTSTFAKSKQGNVLVIELFCI